MSELEYWTRELQRGRISRREFMGRAAALGASTALVTSLLNQAGLAAEPKRGGSASFGLPHGATTDTGDPAGYPDTATQVPFWGAMSNSLTDIDTKGDVVPDLCETMEPADKAATWIFKLRKGLSFHDGKDVTAEDVVASFRHHMGSQSKSAVKSVLKSIKDIKTDGKSTVVFSLDAGNADFPYLTSDYHLPIMPARADGTADWQSNVRTGPFVFVSWEPGVRATLKRYPNYHKAGRPYFDEVAFLTIADVTARTNALTTDAVDWIGRADLKTLALLAKNPNIAIAEVTGYGHYAFPMDVTAAPFDNVDVRTALKWAINRDEIAAKVFVGHALPGNDNPIAPSIKFAVDPAPKYSYDPEKARFHLKKAGLSELRVDLSAADAAFNGAVDAAALYQEQAKAAGISINIVREPNDGYWDNVWLKKPWVATYWGGRPTCDWMFTLVYAKGGSWNETKWANPRFNELLLAARSETDDKQRAAMYAEMQQLVHDDGGVIVLVFNNYVDAHSKRLAHGPLSSNLSVDGLRIAERWWFA